MLKIKSVALLTAIALLSSCTNTPPISQTGDQSAQPVTTAAAPLSYESYAMILRTYVDANGLVNYPALQANPQPLKDFVAMIGAVSPDTYATWNDNEKIAFLINAYNAITLESIINQTPLKGSIKDIIGVWNFTKHTVMGRSITLDTIEHEILRKDFREPRIHAALVCAAISCPTLRQEPYTGADLDTQLDDQVNKWLSGPHGLRIDRTQNQVSISAIFDWFGEDWQPQQNEENETTEGQFVGNPKERAVLSFISNYVSAEDRNYLVQGNYKLDYLPYDWALNQQ